MKLSAIVLEMVLNGATAMPEDVLHLCGRAMSTLRHGDASARDGDIEEEGRMRLAATYLIGSWVISSLPKVAKERVPWKPLARAPSAKSLYLCRGQRSQMILSFKLHPQ